MTEAQTQKPLQPIDGNRDQAKLQKRTLTSPALNSSIFSFAVGFSAGY
jgi:hypothetical protein